MRFSFLISVLMGYLFNGAPQLHESFTTLPGSDLIKITGRVKRTKDAVTIYWPGTRIAVQFTGDTLKARLRDEHGNNYFNIVLDGDSLRYIKLDTTLRSYVLAAGLSQGTHTVELIKRTEWDQGKTWFYGLDVKGTLHTLPPDNGRVIEFFGNSITAGYAIENNTGGDSPDSIYTNNYNTYAMRTARYFNADCYLTVKSGIGITVSWFPIIMPELYNRLDPNDSTSRWNFSQVSPDIVVINLFQNDAWLVHMPEQPSFKQRFGSQPPDAATIIAAYQSFVKKIRGVYPSAQIICALGPMDATREGSPWPNYVKQAIQPLQDDKIHTLFFPFMNKSGHPRVADNKVMADQLIRFIEAHGWWQ